MAVFPLPCSPSRPAQVALFDDFRSKCLIFIGLSPFLEFSEIMFDASEVMSVRTEVMFDASEAMFVRTDVVFVPTEIMFVHTDVVSLHREVMSVRTEVMFDASEVMSIRTEVVFDASEVRFDGTSPIAGMLDGFYPVHLVNPVVISGVRCVWISRK